MMSNEQIRDLLESGLQRGVLSSQVLRLDGNVADTETVTIGADVYEVDVINTDSTDNTANGDFNNTTDPLILEDFTTDYPNVTATEGRLIRIQNEIMRISSVIGTRVTLQRGHSGTTNATHADALDIFESAAGFTAGRIPVGLVTTLTNDAFGDALVDVVNNYATADVRALKIAADEVIIHSKDADGSAEATTETLATASNEFGAATLVGQAAGRLGVACIRRSVTATEVALGNAQFLVDFNPIYAIAFVYTVSNNNLKLWNGDLALTAKSGDDPGYVTINNDGTTDFAAGDAIAILIIGTPS